MARTKDHLAQYFTPPAVAAFAFDALAALGVRAGRPRLIDPACGDGVFLRLARQRLPKADLWGCDLDGALAERWRAAGLAGPAARMLVQDGLHDAPCDGVASGTFDLVVGNPPYGFGVPRPAAGERIEALFLRRFVELARPGGWLAIVVPEGILANARSQKLRDWFLARAALRAVIALPEATFGRTGTRARTAILLARKDPQAGRLVVLASPLATHARAGRALEAYLGDVLAALKGQARGATREP